MARSVRAFYGRLRPDASTRPLVGRLSDDCRSDFRMTKQTTEADGSAEVECVGCQQMGRRDDLERFVYHESAGLIFDMRGGAPGREMYLHPLPGCARAAAWAGFSRAAETPLRDLEADEVIDQVRDGLARRLAERVGEAARLDKLHVGRSAVERAHRRDDLELILVDPEAGNDVGRFADRLEETSEIGVFRTIPGGLLTDALGAKVVIAGPVPGERGAAIGRTAEKLICIEQDEG